MDEHPLPTAAVIVAVIQIIIGVWTLIEMLIALAQSNVSLDVSVLFLVTGIGLLNKRAWARMVGRVMHIIVMVLVPTCLGMMLLGGGLGGGITATGLSGNPVLDALGVAIAIATYVFHVWAVFVLGRLEVMNACR